MLSKTWVSSLPVAFFRPPFAWQGGRTAGAAALLPRLPGLACSGARSCAAASSLSAGAILLAVVTRMPNSIDSEAELLSRARQLDARALGEIHDVYYPEIYRYALYRLGDPEAAADLAAEVFLRLLNALHANRAPRTTLRGWLFGVAAHLAADHWRGHDPAPLTDDLPDGQSVPAEAERRMQRAALRAALPRLTEEQQQVLALRFGDGFSVEESARILGKSVTAAKALQFRAVEALKRLLGDQR